MQDIEKLKEKLQSSRPVPWDAIPDIPLYMDQIVSYLKRQNVTALDEESAITSAMINNYIKSGLLPRADGKRYGKEHVAYLTAISILKNSLSVRDMSILLKALVSPGEVEEFYGELLKIIDEVMDTTAAAVNTQMDEEELVQSILVFAVTASACKMACQHMLASLKQLHPEVKAENK